METLIKDTIVIRKKVDPSYAAKGMDYEEYRRLIDAMIIVGKSTSKNDSDALLGYSKLNVVRMKRLDRTVEIIPELEETVRRLSAPQTWLVITEGWCGDAAQIVPVLNKLTELNDHIQLKFLLRDENLELMDQYLTNGRSRSIPVVIALNEYNEELFRFGPRPTVAQEMFYHLKANAVSNDAVKEEIHSWYAKDKTVTTQQEILTLLKQNAGNALAII